MCLPLGFPWAQLFQISLKHFLCLFRIYIELWLVSSSRPGSGEVMGKLKIPQVKSLFRFGTLYLFTTHLSAALYLYLSIFLSHVHLFVCLHFRLSIFFSSPSSPPARRLPAPPVPPTACFLPWSVLPDQVCT